MEVLVHFHAAQNLFLTFSVFKASLIVGGSMTSKNFNRFSSAGG